MEIHYSNFVFVQTIKTTYRILLGCLVMGFGGLMTTYYTPLQAEGLGSKEKSTLSDKDKTFMVKAAQRGMTEVQLGKIASKKGSRNDLREFGKRMVKDHSNINNDLKTLAAKKGVSLPKKLDGEHQKLVNDMAKLSGPDFDRVYLVAMMKNHRQDLTDFKDIQQSTRDADLKDLLDKSLIVIGAHMDHLKKIQGD